MVIGTIDLFFFARRADGRLHYKSEQEAYELFVPLNEQTVELTYKIEIRLSDTKEEVAIL